MLFLITIVGIGIFINIYIRLGAVESKLKELEKRGVGAKVPVPPSPVKAQTQAETIASPQSVPVPPAPPQAASKKEGSTEFAVGSRLLTGVGVLALILGVSFFLRYAFANNLISEGMRVALGVIFGLVIVIIGHVLRKKYAQYGHTLIGAGLGILYLTAYSAYSFYHLITVVPAFIILLIITAGGVALSLSYNSKSLVGYAFAGAFIIPLILPLSDSVHALFAYLLVLNIGVLLVARFKIWPEFTLASLGATALLYLQWVFGPYTESLFEPTLAYGTIIFFIYFITSLLNFVYRDRDYKGIDGVLLYIIPIAYFVLMLTIVHGKDNVAILSALIGLFYIVLSFVIRAGFSQLGDLRKFSNALLCVASPFIAAATVLHFEGSTVTIIWAIEAVVMILVGYILKTSSNRIAGIVLSVLVGIRMLVVELDLPANSEAIFNQRSATLFFIVLSFIVIWKLYNAFIPKLEGVNKDELTAGTVVSAIGLYAALFFWVTLEAHDFLDSYNLYLPAIWMILAAIMLSVGTFTKEKIFRVLSYVLVFVSGFIALVFQSTLADSHPVIFNIRVGTAILGILLITFILWLFKVQKDTFSPAERNIGVTLLLVANGYALWAGSLELLSFFKGNEVGSTKRVALSGYWLVYALCGLGVGIFRKSIFVRYASIILFAVTIFKIFIYDTANLSDVYRFVSFITLGVILLIAGFAYYKFKHRILEFVSGTEKTVV